MKENIPPAPGDPQSIVSAVKSLRKNITFEAETLRSLPKTRETSLAMTKLEEGVMWLGKELQRLGDLFPDLLRDPYPTSKDPTITTIDPPAPDVAGPPKDNRPEWLIRLVEERNQLLERIEKLVRFLDLVEQNKVAIDQQSLGLLNEQARVMDQYLGILERRLSLVPVECRSVEGSGACACNSTEPSSEACDHQSGFVAPDGDHASEPPKVNPAPPAPIALTDQEMAMVAKYVRGEAAGPIEPNHVQDAMTLAFCADASGLRVMSSEDFATVRREVKRQREAAGKLDDQGFFQDVIASMDKVISILDAWNPPGR